MLCLVVLSIQTPLKLWAQATEYEVKAAFLFHFAQLVEWESVPAESSGHSLDLCLFADEPHLQEIRTTVDGKSLGTAVMHVRLLSDTSKFQGCSILFLSRDETRRQAAVLRSVRGLPILTVGETDSFFSDGGMISFRFEENRIRFDINVDAAGSAHLKISSRLLLLATSVIRGGPRGGK